MTIISLLYAIIISTIFILLYVKVYSRYFNLRKHYYIGISLLLISIYIQFISNNINNVNIKYVGILSFITYPLSILLIFKTNIFNNLFLSLNAILKIYIAFVLFGTIYAVLNDIQYSTTWINGTNYFNLSQGHAYLISIGSLLLADHLLLKDKLKYFFQLKRNLLLIISIQLILIINMIWISVSNNNIPYVWYNNVLLLISFSVEIIYFLLRLFTANSSYFSSYKVHTNTLKKQLTFQLEHYKNYEEQMENFLKFKHDYDKVLSGIANLLVLKDYDSIKEIVADSSSELSQLNFNYKTYSNNLILDALLNDYAKRFERINAKFNSLTYINMININELRLIKLFYNILENAYEALLKVENTNNRIINIKTELLDNYIKLSFINTTITSVIDENIKTDKLNSITHGFGKSIISDILNDYDGFSNSYLTTEDNLSFYNLEIFLPLD